MTEISRPDFTYQWSSGGAIVAPSNAKIQTGWTAEVPPFQWENWSQNRQDNALVHIFQKGISVWSSTQDYYFTASAPKAFVQGSDGLIYEAVQSSTNQNPTTDTTNSYWRQAFRNQSGSPIYALDTGTANTYKADYVPVVKTLVDGMVLRFKALNANTGASTFTPNNGVITAAPIVGTGHTALTMGVISVNGDVWLQWNSSIGGGSWVLIASTGVNTSGGRLLGAPQIFSTPGTFTYTPTPGTARVIVEVQAAGGAGGGAVATGAGQNAIGAPGGAGSYAKSLLSSGFSGATVVVGAGGVGVTASAGGNGGTSSFGAGISCPGGRGGPIAGPSGGQFDTASLNSPAPTGGNITSNVGSASINMISQAAGLIVGALPGGTIFGPGAQYTTTGTNGTASTSFGSGGGATSNIPSAGSSRIGGNGAPGIVIIWEYA